MSGGGAPSRTFRQYPSPSAVVWSYPQHIPAVWCDIPRMVRSNAKNQLRSEGTPTSCRFVRSHIVPLSPASSARYSALLSLCSVCLSLLRQMKPAGTNEAFAIWLRKRANSLGLAPQIRELLFQPFPSFPDSWLLAKGTALPDKHISLCCYFVIFPNKDSHKQR